MSPPRRRKAKVGRDSTTVAIDPGLRGSGVSIFLNGVLQHAEYVEIDEMTERGPGVWRDMGRAVARALNPTQNITTLVLEIPQIYIGAKYNPDDLLQVTGSAAAVAALVPAAHVVGVYPRQWTKQVKKAERHVALKAELDAAGHDEAAKVKPASWASLTHNVWDAVGIGYYYVCKTGERR